MGIARRVVTKQLVIAVATKGISKMTYARSRLYLGITAVGSMVVFAVFALITRLPYSLFPAEPNWRATDVITLMLFVLGFTLFTLPFDVVGGYVLPKRFGRKHPSLNQFVQQWSTGVAFQIAFFVISGLVILGASRLGGLVAATLAVGGLAVSCIVSQGWIARILNRNSGEGRSPQLEAAMTQCELWGLPRVKTIVARHTDPGFTGGIVGLPGRETIIVPKSWLSLLSSPQLAAVIARRIEAISSGSRTRGLLLALCWTIAGFMFSCLFCGGAPVSVAQLIAICFTFTCWTFLGLLILPSISRQSAYALDQRIKMRGVSPALLQRSLREIDHLQDDEPERPALVETIFHPVPAVERRDVNGGTTTAAAWHAARTTLFLSWSCLGLLSRSVHCNSGRPELWTLLPTD